MNCHNNIYYPKDSEECAVIKCLLASRTWEKSIVNLFKKYLTTGDIAIDVGCFIGLHSLKLNDIVGETGLVFAVEAIPHVYDCFLKTVNEKQKKSIIPLNFALHDQVDVPLNFVSDHTGQSAVVEHRKKSFKYNYTLNSRTLDEYFLKLNLPKINLMKIDVEGHEFKVLKGGEKIITIFRPIIIMETWRTKSNLLKLNLWCVDNRYEMEKINSENWLLIPNEKLEV